MRRQFRFVGEYRNGMELAIGDIYKRDGIAWIVTAGGPKPAAVMPDPLLDRIPLDGKPGERGADGRDGVDGASAPLILPAGNWRAGKVYPPLSIVSHLGSSYLATAEVRREPPGKGWQLLAARGEDGKKIESWHTRQLVRQAPSVAAGASVTAIFDSNTLAGQVIYISGDGHVDLAQANGRPQTRAIGISARDVVAGQAGEYIPVGPVSCESWNLSAGSVYYLDPSTPGGMTTTYPTASGLFVVILGVATSEKQLSLSIHYLLEQS